MIVQKDYGDNKTNLNNTKEYQDKKKNPVLNILDTKNF